MRRRDLEPIEADLSLMMQFLMGIDARLETLEKLLTDGDDGQEDWTEP